MQLLNEAFDSLRRVVPRTHLADYQKLSKIATLRLAIQYIRAMHQILREGAVQETGMGHEAGPPPSPLLAPPPHNPWDCGPGHYRLLEINELTPL